MKIYFFCRPKFQNFRFFKIWDFSKIWNFKKKILIFFRKIGNFEIFVDQKIFSEKVFRDYFLFFVNYATGRVQKTRFQHVSTTFWKKFWLMKKIWIFSKISKNPIFKLEAEVFRVSQSAKNGVKRRVWVLRKNIRLGFWKKFSFFFIDLFFWKIWDFLRFFENFRQLQSQNFFKNFFYFHF